MTKSRWLDSSRLEVVVAILIAIVSLTTALAAWRTNVVGSSAGDANRQGLIDAVKQQAAFNEDWRKVYEEAGYAQGYAVYAAGVTALEASGDPAALVQAQTLRENLVSGLQTLSQPLGTDSRYLLPNGTFDLQKRFKDLQAETPDLAALDPQASFELSESYSSEQRWLTVGAVLLALSLFWLALAQIGRGGARLLTMLIGLGIYGFGLLWFAVVEILFFVSRGGAL